jgi:hypothetical protein
MVSPVDQVMLRAEGVCPGAALGRKLEPLRMNDGFEVEKRAVK